MCFLMKNLAWIKSSGNSFFPRSVRHFLIGWLRCIETERGRREADRLSGDEINVTERLREQGCHGASPLSLEWCESSGRTSYRQPPPPPEIIPFPLLTLYVTNIRLIRKLKFCQTRVSSVQFNFLIFWLTAKFPQRCWLDDQCFFSWIPTCRLHLVQVHVTNCTLISSLSGGSALSFHTHLYRKHSAEYIPYNTQSLTVPGYIYLYISSCALQTLSPLGIITFDRPAVYYLVN